MNINPQEIAIALTEILNYEDLGKYKDGNLCFPDNMWLKVFRQVLPHVSHHSCSKKYTKKCYDTFYRKYDEILYHYTLLCNENRKVVVDVAVDVDLNDIRSDINVQNIDSKIDYNLVEIPILDGDSKSMDIDPDYFDFCDSTSLICSSIDSADSSDRN